MDSVVNRPWRCVVALLLLLVLLVPSLLHPATVMAALEYNERVPLNDDFDTCTGEQVTMNGFQHIVGRLTTDDAGRLHFGFTRNTYGVGVGQSSGAAYRLIDTVSRANVEIPAGGVITFSEGYQSRLLRQGEGAPNDDTMIHFVSHITINANGDVIASVEITQVVCR